ncbi:MAG: nuclear transport factor 2 family protein [Solirubrobacterales bacterium]
MSQENVEFVQQIYADPRGLIGTASERAAPEVEFDFTDVYPDRPVLKGIEEMRRFRDTGPWSGSPIHIEPERFIDVDDERVLAFVRVMATGRDSGIEVEVKPAHQFTIRDGLIVRFKAYRHRAQALEAVGLRPSGRP